MLMYFTYTTIPGSNKHIQKDTHTQILFDPLLLLRVCEPAVLTPSCVTCLAMSAPCATSRAMPRVAFIPRRQSVAVLHEAAGDQEVLGAWDIEDLPTFTLAAPFVPGREGHQ